MEGERMALLAVRADIGGIDQWLSPWEGEGDCCHWEGVGCDGRSGHVVKLDLRRPGHVVKHDPRNPYYSAFYYYEPPEEKSKVNPSLLNLTSLKYLDLSCNDFVGAQIPSFIGSLVHLEYVNLSRAGFAGTVPPQLGGLQNLRTLDLSHGSGLKVESLRWLSHLTTHLQYLDMSWVDLSAATDWFQVINTLLPSLSTLRLSGCELPNLHPTSTLPHANFTPLSTLDLSWNYFISTWPLWLFNATSLTMLDLSGNYDLHGPIPDGFGNMKHLEALSLKGASFEGVIPRSLWALDKLKLLHLSCRNLRLGLPNDMANLTNLQELELDGVDGRIPASLGNLSHLESLSLYGGNITGGIPESLGDLVNLEYLCLDNIPGEMPESLGNLSHLESLILHGGNTTGGIPESLGRLANLEYLKLFNISGEMPESLGSLSHLEFLAIGGNNITGGMPESLGDLVNLKYLYSSGVTIGRGVMRSMGHLCNLTTLRILRNMARGAEVNELLEGLSRCTGGSGLETLDLRGNGFGGHLPDQVGQLKNLQLLDLSDNSIVGSIPASIGKLTSLTMLFLSNNKLTGLVPSSVGKLSNVTYLDMSSNGFEGVLSEAHFANLSRLEVLDMSSNPALSLNISWAWIPPFQIFLMRGCNVGPEFPQWLQTQKTLYHLDLSSNVISQSLPDNFFHSFPYMYSLNLSHNQISGALPLSFSSAPFIVLDLSFNYFETSEVLQLHPGSSSLRFLDLSHNNISGTLDVYAGGFQLEYLDLSHNNINGRIPLSICQIKSLEVLDLSYNHLTGEIPGCWENSSLVALKLSHNSLSGPIPSSPRMLPELTSLHLDKNNLVGVIPSFLKYSTQLETLDLGENHLSGVIPTWLGESLSSLQILRLRSNMFYGTIPTSLSQLQQLRILDLACNRLSGNLLLSFHNFSAMVRIEKILGPLLPSKFASAPSINFEESIRIVPKGNELEYTTILPLVTIIDLSNNSLSGRIPEEITCLEGLRFLILSRNHLEGRIPTSISRMLLLESLDLSFNRLSGNIPLSISTIHFLSSFNISYNNLHGRIPSGSQPFDQSAYIGNPSLCGPPLLRPCPDDVISKDPILQPSEEHEDKHEPYKIWLYIGMGTGFAAGFWGFFGMLLAMEKKRVAYFRFIDYVADELYVMIVIHFARLKIKISSWMHG